MLQRQKVRCETGVPVGYGIWVTPMTLTHSIFRGIGILRMEGAY